MIQTHDIPTVTNRVMHLFKSNVYFLDIALFAIANDYWTADVWIGVIVSRSLSNN